MGSELPGPTEVSALKARIERLEGELASVRADLRTIEEAATNRDLQEESLSLSATEDHSSHGPSTGITAASSNEEKIALYRQRFAGRDDAYAHRWTNQRTGKSGALERMHVRRRRVIAKQGFTAANR